MANRDIVVIGASAGGVEALKAIAAALPENLPASVLVVMHMPEERSSLLPKILSRAGPLPAVPAEEGEPLTPGRIYTCIPDRHLLVLDHHLHLSRGPHENRFRPAIDPLFRSAAQYYGERVIGVVLSGAGDDGTAGLIAIKKQGGIAIVQDPDDALYERMPRSAIENANVDYVLPAGDIADLLARLSREAVKVTPDPIPNGVNENDIRAADLNLRDMEKPNRPGKPSVYACPECGGVLWEIREAEQLRFRCRVGHAYGAESLVDAQSAALEEALWAALRALEEKTELCKRMAEQMQARGRELTAAHYRSRMEDGEKQAARLRQLLEEGK